MIAGLFFGPLAGGLVGLVGEMSGFFIGLQMGGYDPVFSIVMGIYGVVAGLFYLKAKSDPLWRIMGLTAVGIVITTLIKSIYLTAVYNIPAGAIIPSQAVTAGIELPVFILLMAALVKSLRPVVNRIEK